MKAILVSFFLLTGLILNAQSIRVDVSSDSILLGNTVKVTFVVENSESELDVPEFDMPIVSGPNQSSSIQIINGHKSSSQSFTYYLKPNSEGQFFIPPARLIDEDNILETQAIEINVYPNPDGIINNIEPNNNFFFESMEFPFGGFDMNDFWNNANPPINPNEKTDKKKNSKSNQKVRKI